MERRAARSRAMNGSTLMYCSIGGCPRVIAIRPVSNRNRYARKNATMPSTASVATWNATSSRLCRLTIAVRPGAPTCRRRRARSRSTNRAREKLFGVARESRRHPSGIARRAAAPPASESTVVSPNEHAGLAVDHGVERAAASERHDGTAAGLRFDGHDAEVFFAGQDGRRATSDRGRGSLRRCASRRTRCRRRSSARGCARSGPLPTTVRPRRPAAQPSSRDPRACKARAPTPRETWA